MNLREALRKIHALEIELARRESQGDRLRMAEEHLEEARRMLARTLLDLEAAKARAREERESMVEAFEARMLDEKERFADIVPKIAESLARGIAAKS